MTSFEEVAARLRKLSEEHNIDEQYRAWMKSFEGSFLPFKYEHTGKPIAKIVSVDPDAGTMIIEPIE